ncbi:SIR2 family protein [Neisseria lactamica]|uniref:SIR2 family protein n=1 Tax=Neisseria lactamica TaxID=486 RepID=UPI000E56826B|nr:SIR2 family protein [Neisseria lactamica]
MTLTKERLIKELVKELSEHNLAVFAGAGLSASAGFVNWQELLSEIAEDLGLDVKKETDLIGLAQYYVNSKANNRSRINELILERLSDGEPTENHKILARLPIHTFWTTNYDKLIEKSLENIGKIVDVKHETKQLSQTKYGRDVVVYKMHGDVEHPTDTVIIKDDYERYLIQRGDFFTLLKGELLNKRFLFLGFSFSDPNIDYILSRVRASHSQNQKEHYCILRKVQKEENESQADFEYRQRKQQLFVADLNRVSVQVLLVDEYNEITELLKTVEKKLKQKTIFISGAAADYAPYNQADVENFVSELTKEILKLGYRVVTGYGLGIGSAVISGALDYLLREKKVRVSEENLILRPFPQDEQGKQQWTAYREDMIAYAGISLFIFGNKKDGKGSIVLSNGMREEFDISKRNGNILIPVATTGSIAKELCVELLSIPSESLLTETNFRKISVESASLEQIKQSILEILSEVRK